MVKSYTALLMTALAATMHSAFGGVVKGMAPQLSAPKTKRPSETKDVALCLSKRRTSRAQVTRMARKAKGVRRNRLAHRG